MLATLLSRFSPDLAIDLGTANTLIGAPGRGIVLDEPSIVAVEESTRRVLANGCAVGHLARQMLGRTPESIAVVRPLARGVITDFRLCEAMLRHFLRKAQGDRWRARPRVLIAVPASITAVERQAVLNSAQRAGARQVRLIPEAQAAALGAGLPITEPVASMICDVGGGTTEIAVLSVGEIVSARSVRLGGDSFDEAVVAHLRRRHNLRISAGVAEQLRIDIGGALVVAQERSVEVSGIDAVSGLPRRVPVTGSEIREALAAPLEEIVDAIKSTLDGCSPDLAADLVDHGLVLAGGGSLLTEFDRYLERQLGVPVRRAADPLRAVARGVLLCLENPTRWKRALEAADQAA